MRKTYVKFITCLVFTIAVAALCLPSASAQTRIFDYDQSWQYYQEGNEPAPSGGVTWRTNTYNDTSWSTGPGVFAYEDAPGPYPPILTPLNRTLGGVSGGTTNITYYFRTHFNFPINPTNTFVYFTNVVDDGMILYLNGLRLYDFRVAQVNPAWSQYASGGPPQEGARELFVLTNGTTPRIRQGDNVLAVELHDGSLGSSDVAFGLALAYRVLQPIVIVQQPDPRVDAQVFDTIDLSVVVTGDNPRYWWFKDNVFLNNPPQTNSTLRISSAQTINSGTYFVVISNTISGVRSSNSVVSVVPDTFPPELVTAAINENDTNRVYAIFTEDVLTINNRNPLLSATNLANYTISEATNRNNKLTITAATVGVGQKSVRLTINTNIDCSRVWVLTVRNLTDRRTNSLLHNPSEAIIGCVDRIGAVDFDAFWYFIPTYDEAQILPTNSANAWYTTNYQVDANWAGGNAPFYFKSGCFSNCYGFFGTSGASTNCGALGSPVSIGYPTIAFRREFIVPSNSPAVGQLRFQHVTDDGAIFYLNGKELLRYNMTNVPVTFNYFAPCILNEPTCQTQAYTLNNLLVGTNVLCAEVHSCDEFDGADFMFGCQLDIIVTNYATQIPEIRVTRTPATNAVKRVFLDWDYPGWQLQTSTNLANTNLGATGWTNVMNGAVPYPTNLTRYTNNPTEVGRGRHYRLVWPRPR